MIEDYVEEFLTASSGDRGFVLPSPRRHGMGALPAPVTTTPWMKNTPAMMTVPSWTAALWPEAGLPFEQCRACHGAGGSKRNPMLGSPPSSKR
jgi:mono/diheme cytochrome c family protein